jgi:dihydroxyacetone kinase
VLINGLGATKYEELFVRSGQVDLLADAGVELIDPESR